MDCQTLVCRPHCRAGRPGAIGEYSERGFCGRGWACRLWVCVGVVRLVWVCVGGWMYARVCASSTVCVYVREYFLSAFKSLTGVENSPSPFEMHRAGKWILKIYSHYCCLMYKANLLNFLTQNIEHVRRFSCY